VVDLTISYLTEQTSHMTTRRHETSAANGSEDEMLQTCVDSSLSPNLETIKGSNRSVVSKLFPK
jgi:hypothetical protein